MSDDEDLLLCENCGADITEEQYHRTGVTEFCDDCPELCCDPRSKTFGCGCEEEE